MIPFIVIWSTLAVIVDVALARVAFGAIVPSLRGDLGLTLAAAGAANAANLIGYIGATPLAAPVISRIGLRKTSIVGHFVAAGGALLMAGASGFIILFVARVVTGVGGAIGLVAALRLALDTVPAQRRVAVSTATWCGVGLGLVAASGAQSALLAPGAWRVAALIWATATATVAIMTPVPRLHAELPTAAHGAIRGYRLILVAYVGFGFAFLAFTTFLTLAGTGTAASRWASLGIAALVGSISVTRVRHAERALCAAFAAGALGALATAAHQVFGPFLVGLGLAATPALTTAVVRSRVPNVSANGAIANATMAVALGQLVGPVIAGALADRFGVVVVPLMSAVVFAVAGALVAADVRRYASTDQCPPQINAYEPRKCMQLACKHDVSLDAARTRSVR